VTNGVYARPERIAAQVLDMVTMHRKTIEEVYVERALTHIYCLLRFGMRFGEPNENEALGPTLVITEKLATDMADRLERSMSIMGIPIPEALKLPEAWKAEQKEQEATPTT
jgi:hypothetical protein